MYYYMSFNGGLMKQPLARWMFNTMHADLYPLDRIYQKTFVVMLELITMDEK